MTLIPSPFLASPALPPDGERILWQGRPQWTSVARRVMHVDLVALYFVTLLLGASRRRGHRVHRIAKLWVHLFQWRQRRSSLLRY